MALTNKGPISFQGLPWEAWTNSLGRSVPIDDKPPEPKSPEKTKAGVMKLSKEDMKIFGLCPERDPFTVVVCETCKMCVKQQALAEHNEKRHLNKDARPVILPIPDRPIVAEKPTAKVVKNPSAKVKRKRVAGKEAGSSASVSGGGSGGSSGGGSAGPAKAKDAVVNSVPSLPVSLTLEGVAPPNVVENPPLKVEPLQPVLTLNPVPVTVTAANSKQTAAKPRRAPRKNAPIKQREYDPDKHCGVVSQETLKPCTWSLTCKSHPMSLRRAVTGRSKPFDQLLADHRKAKEALIKQKKNLDLLNSSIMLTPPNSQPSQPTQSCTPPSSQKEKESPGPVVVSEKVVNLAVRGGIVATAFAASVTSSPTIVHTVTAQTTAQAAPPAPATVTVPVTKQSVVLNPNMSWNLSLVSAAPLVCRVPELKLDVTPAKRIYLSSQPQNLIVKTSSSDKPPLPLPVFVSMSPTTTNQLDILSVSLNPPRALNVPTPLFSHRKVGGLVYANRRMQVARQAMETCLHRAGNTFSHAGTTIYHLPPSFFTTVMDHAGDHQKKNK